ncbi:hypothetical protein B0J13DRAFT_520168 [Dactylonectria estremocensis]|uniref:Uncharacterized protein n=1 Tax=Dactylonectria estremocensis TaxID=1079267 RepID=A0A9P9FBP9_9HYPO|nr:hypothetical protein B0J13DRAFT_520168 [Dactylonectria estremocensis]
MSRGRDLGALYNVVAVQASFLPARCPLGCFAEVRTCHPGWGVIPAEFLPQMHNCRGPLAALSQARDFDLISRFRFPTRCHCGHPITAAQFMMHILPIMLLIKTDLGRPQ